MGALGLSKSSRVYLLKHAHAALLLKLVSRVSLPSFVDEATHVAELSCLGVPLLRCFAD